MLVSTKTLDDRGLNLFQREQFSSYQDYFAFFLSGITSFLTSGAGWGLAIGTGRLNGNPNRQTSFF